MNTAPVAPKRGRRWRRAVLTNAAWLAAALLLAHVWQTRHIPGGPAPEFTGPAVSTQAGATLSLAQWRAAHPGRSVALVFWAEWCAICRLEEGTVSALGADWPVLTVAMQSGDAAAVRQVQAQRGLPWATVVDPQGDIATRYGVRAVPALVVLDAQGRIRASSVGYTTGLGMRLRMLWAQLSGSV